MKKLAVTLIGLAMALQLVQCSSSTKTATVTEDPAIAACKKNCSVPYNKCVQNAGKSDSKKAACGLNMNNCYLKCEGKPPVKMQKPDNKKSKYSEV